MYLHYWRSQKWIQHLRPTHWWKGKDHLPQPTANTLPNAVQEVVGVLFCDWCYLGIQQDPNLLFFLYLKATFHSVHPQPVLLHGVMLLQRQGLVFLFVELHDIPDGLFLQPIDILLNSNTPLWYTNPYSEFCIVCEFPESTLFPDQQVTNEDVKKCQNQYQHLGHITNDWCLNGLDASDKNLINLEVWVVFTPTHCPFSYCEIACICQQHKIYS